MSNNVAHPGRGQPTPLLPTLRQQKIQSIVSNDIEAFKRLLMEDGDLSGGAHEMSPTLLHLAIDRQRTNIFDLMLEVPYLCPFEKMDSCRRTPLLLALSQPHGKEYFALRLLKMGVNVNAVDEDSNSALHYAFRRKFYNVCRLLIRSGANLDALDKVGRTPLHLACQFATVEEVSSLMYFGANIYATTFCNGFTPFDFAIERGINDTDGKEAFAVQKLLYPYFFDCFNDYEVNLQTLISAYLSDTPYLEKIAAKIKIVKYGPGTIEKLWMTIFGMRPQIFTKFHRHFPNVMRDVFLLSNMFSVQVTYEAAPKFIANFVTNLDYILSTELQSIVLDFMISIQLVMTAFSALPGSTSKFIQEIVMVLLTRGKTIDNAELYEIYFRFGRCSLFYCILSMDVLPTYDNLDQVSVSLLPAPSNNTLLFEAMPRLLCDPNLPIGKFLKCCIRTPDYYALNNIDDGLSYFARWTFKEICLANCDEKDYNKLRKRIQNMPKVPSLKELARDAARQHVAKTFNCSNSKKLFAMLQKLPIGNDNIKILTFQKELY